MLLAVLPLPTATPALRANTALAQVQSSSSTGCYGFYPVFVGINCYLNYLQERRRLRESAGVVTFVTGVARFPTLRLVVHLVNNAIM